VTRVAQLSQAETALETLLDSLLSEVPEYREPPPEAVATATEQRSRVSIATAALNISDSEPIEEIPQIEALQGSVRPEWATGDLKILVVGLGGLRVAVPLVRLTGIAPAGREGEVLHLPAQPDWHRGVASVRGRQLVRVDTVSLLELNAQRQKAAYLMLIDEGRYGLEVDTMEEPLTLDSDAVHWRQQGEGRDWVLGMLPEQMCIVLDLDAISGRLGVNT